MNERKSIKINPMKKVEIEKLTINICVGNDKAGMEKAKVLLGILKESRKPAYTCAKRRLATWQIRPGLPIGYKLTLRRLEAIEFLKWVLLSKKNTISEKSFDKLGNFSVGVYEYLDLKGLKYNADVGIMGFEIMVTFKRLGLRVKDRRIRKAKIPMRHKPSKEEVITFLKENLQVEVKK